jgi:PTH1 family peptidyl-tRNA hydrolase
MILIVGLGNYGMEYNGTLHNAGFDVIDHFATENGVEIKKAKCKSLIYEGHILGEKVVLAKPQTYMNLSGEAVVELKNQYKPDKILVIFDDFDIPFGTIRFRNSGSAGTHNGMRNIISLLGTDDFPRLRIGTKPPFQVESLVSYVLGKVPKECKDEYQKSVDMAVEKISEFISKKGIIL